MDIFINPRIIKVDYNRGHRVRYYLYHEEGEEIKIPTGEPPHLVKNSNNVCFAGLIGELKNNKEVNRILYEGQEVGDDKLDATERLYWIRLCKQNQFLPDYVDEAWAEHRRYVLRLNDKELNPSLLYVYLTCFRSLQEDPGFIRAMLYLVPCYQMDFCAAWCLASALTITNNWHNIVEIGRRYGDRGDNVNNITIPISYAIGLKRYIRDPHKYDKRGLRDNDSRPFNVHRTVTSLCQIVKNVRAGDLLSDNVIKALKAEDDKEVAEQLKHLPDIKE